MSNASIIERIESLVEQLQCGDISIAAFAQQFQSHFPALENIDYAHINAAQVASFDMAIPGDSYDGMPSNFSTVAEIEVWVREWLATVPR